MTTVQRINIWKELVLLPLVDSYLGLAMTYTRCLRSFALVSSSGFNLLSYLSYFSRFLKIFCINLHCQ